MRGLSAVASDTDVALNRLAALITDQLPQLVLSTAPKLDL